VKVLIEPHLLRLLTFQVEESYPFSVP